MKSSRDTDIGSALRALRKQHQMTQQELARQSGVSYSFINEVENGKRSIQLDVLNRVADLFGYTVGLVPQQKSSLTDQETK
jgi:HTH-type transcriptional regulator/antitoxin HipB